MRDMVVWTLKRGIVSPAEPLDENNAFRMRHIARVVAERDAPLTERQIYMESRPFEYRRVDRRKYA